MRSLVITSLGRSYANIKPDLRGVPLDNYIILYRIINSGMEIVRVVNGYQNLEFLFADSDE